MLCVIGSGESAASVVSLLRKAQGCCPDGRRADCSRRAVLARGRATTRTATSDPGDWPRLAELPHRREFIERTDRGVFSPQAEAILNQSPGYRALPGCAVAIDAYERQVVVTIGYDSETERVAYDLVVVAVGFDARWFERWLGRGLASGTATRLAPTG